MKVFDPFSTYPSPSRRAVDFIPPKASEPEPGSVMAQAPIFSSVSSGSPQRSFWAIVPFDMIAAAVRPTHAERRHHARAVVTQLDDRNEAHADVLCAPLLARLLRRRAARRHLLALDLLLEADAGHLVEAEGLHHLAQDVVGRQVAMLELHEVRLHLRLDEAADHIADELMLLAPLDHAYSASR